MYEMVVVPELNVPYVVIPGVDGYDYSLRIESSSKLVCGDLHVTCPRAASAHTKKRLWRYSDRLIPYMGNWSEMHEWGPALMRIAASSGGCLVKSRGYSHLVCTRCGYGIDFQTERKRVFCPACRQYWLNGAQRQALVSMHDLGAPHEEVIAYLDLIPRQWEPLNLWREKSSKG